MALMLPLCFTFRCSVIWVSCKILWDEGPHICGAVFERIVSTLQNATLRVAVLATPSKWIVLSYSSVFSGPVNCVKQQSELSGRYALPVFTGHVHGSQTRPVFEHGCPHRHHYGHPCSLAPVHTTRVHGLSTRPVNTGNKYRVEAWHYSQFSGHYVTSMKIWLVAYTCTLGHVSQRLSGKRLYSTYAWTVTK